MGADGGNTELFSLYSKSEICLSGLFMPVEFCR